MRLNFSWSTILCFAAVCVTQTVAVELSEAIEKPIMAVERSRDDTMMFEFLTKLESTLEKYFASKLHFDIGYYLFTPRNPTEKYNLKPNKKSLEDSPFDSELETKFIIHGFKSILTNNSVFYDIKDEMLKVKDYNVIVVDWSKYNQGVYVVVSVNAIITGLEVANFIQFLIENAGTTAQRVHMIGHSLGAQVAAFTGKTTPGLARITGLDTAGPIFQVLPQELRLTHKDANFVDGIHTNGALDITQGLGYFSSYADIDFYPNGGSVQPACGPNDTFQATDKEVSSANTIINKMLCSHDRAPFLFLESIRQCNFLSVLCDDFRKGDCLPQGQCPSEGSVTANMGFHAKPFPSLPPKSTFFLRTKGKSPFCIDCNKTK